MTFADFDVLVITHYEAVKRRQFFIGWIVAVATCAAVVLADLLIRPLHVRVMGLDVSSGLTGATYVAAAAMAAATFGWFRMAPKRARRITVRELRERAVPIGANGRRSQEVQAGSFFPHSDRSVVVKHRSSSHDRAHAAGDKPNGIMMPTVHAEPSAACQRNHPVGI